MKSSIFGKIVINLYKKIYRNLCSGKCTNFSNYVVVLKDIKGAWNAVLNPFLDTLQ